jgi:hypothetical protein
MHPVKINIVGDFWDSFIYQGLLYIWEMDGSVNVFDWQNAIYSLSYKLIDSDVFEYAFSRGDYFYKNHSEAEKEHLIKGLQNIANLDITLTLDDLLAFQKCKISTPFFSLHDDLDIYNLHLYALCEKGLLRTSVNRGLGDDQFLRQSIDKCFDEIGGAFKIYDSNIALAAGSNGLFEIDTISKHVEQVDKRHVSFANWQYASIVATSLISDSYLAGYRKIENNNKCYREFIKAITTEEIFDGQGISWGNMDKIYMFLNGEIHTRQSFPYTMERFLPEAKRTKEVEEWQRDYKKFHPFNIENPKTTLVNADTAYFGTILEFEDRIIVARSDEKIDLFKGEFTRFRVYPRSKYYENHLHIIEEEALVIYSFNHDYFIDQDLKSLGIRYRDDNISESQPTGEEHSI